MVKLHLELEGDVGEVVRVLRRIGGGDNAGGEVRDGLRSAPTGERTAAVDTIPERGTTETSATLVPGHWTEELATDFTAGLDVVAGRVLWHVWRAGERGIHRNVLCQRAGLAPAELRSLLIRLGRVLGRFQRERGMALSRPMAANSPLRSYFVDPEFAAVASDLFNDVKYAGLAVQWLAAPLTNACHRANQPWSVGDAVRVRRSSSALRSWISSLSWRYQPCRLVVEHAAADCRPVDRVGLRR